jgi:hypothetical protein
VELSDPEHNRIDAPMILILNWYTFGMKKAIIALILLILFIRFVPIWPNYRVWTGEKTYITTWHKILLVYYKDKVVY